MRTTIEKPEIKILLDCAEKEKNVHNKFSYTLKILDAYFLFSKSLKEYERLEKLIDQCKRFYLQKEKCDNEIIIQLLLIEAHLKRYQWKTKPAKANLKQCRLLLKDTPIGKYHAYYYYNKGALKYQQQLYLTTIRLSKKSLKLLKETPGGIKKNKLLYVQLNAQLFSAYNKIGEIESAFTHYFETIEFSIANKIYRPLADMILGFCLLCTFTKAKTYFEQEKQRLSELYEESQSAYLKEYLAILDILELDLYSHLGKIDDLAYFKLLSGVLDKHRNTLSKSKIKYTRGVYFVYSIDLHSNLQDKETAFFYCNELCDLIKDSSSVLTFNLLHELTLLCMHDKTYINRIKNQKIYKIFNIENIDDLFERLISFSKTRRVYDSIIVYNQIINYYKGNLNTNKQQEIFIDCVTELQKICSETSKFKVQNLVTLHKSQQEIEEKNKILDHQKKLINFFKEFSYTAAHDLKQPLSTIIGFAKIIKKTYNNMSEEKMNLYLEKIVVTSKALKEFINELLDYEISINNSELVSINLLDVIEQVKINLSKCLERSNGKIILKNMDTSILAKKTLIEILFQNLISNAIKYKNENISPLIKINYNKVDRVFSIQDNGIGIEPKMQKKIFKPFFTIPNKKVVGTGIGLATCKRIIESFGGKIWLESEVGKGSTFYFTLKRS